MVRRKGLLSRGFGKEQNPRRTIIWVNIFSHAPEKSFPVKMWEFLIATMRSLVLRITTLEAQ
jgi:hypothetical protein